MKALCIKYAGLYLREPVLLYSKAFHRPMPRRKAHGAAGVYASCRIIFHNRDCWIHCYSQVYPHNPQHEYAQNTCFVHICCTERRKRPALALLFFTIKNKNLVYYLLKIPIILEGFILFIVEYKYMPFGLYC